MPKRTLNKSLDESPALEKEEEGTVWKSMDDGKEEESTPVILVQSNKKPQRSK